MPWDPDSLLSRLDGALALYARRHGEEAALDWLKRESERVSAALRAEQNASLSLEEPARAEAEDRAVEKLKDTVAWYADPINWHPRKKMLAPAVIDAGELARQTLEEVEGDPATSDAPADDVEGVQNTISELSAALAFYEKPANYRRAGDRPAVINDGGQRAREALDAVYGTGKGGGGEGHV